MALSANIFQVPEQTKFPGTTSNFNPLKHSVTGAVTLTQNSQLLKYIPEISNEFFTFIIYLQIAFTVLGIGMFFNSGRVSV